MPHAVESGFAVVQDGVAGRSVPWHGLGNQVSDVLTAKEALVASGLDWEVELFPMFARMARTEGTAEVEIEVPDQFAVVRDKDDALLGVVGSLYVPVQNHKAFEMFDAIVADGEAKYETAWSLRGGKIIAITAKLPQTIMVAGEDAHDLYMVITTSHDGSKALTVFTTVIRVVCKNTLRMALNSAKNVYTIKHTSKAEGRIQEAREALKLTFDYGDAFQKEAEAMIDQEFTKGQFEKLVEKLIPAKSNDPSDAAIQTQMALIGTLESSKTIDDAIRFTKWGAMNAVSEYADWIRPISSRKGKSIAEVRTESVLFGTGAKLKSQAFALLGSN